MACTLPLSPAPLNTPQSDNKLMGSESIRSNQASFLNGRNIDFNAVITTANYKLRHHSLKDSYIKNLINDYHNNQNALVNEAAKRFFSQDIFKENPVYKLFFIYFIIEIRKQYGI